MKIKITYKNVSSFVQTANGVFVFGDKYSDEKDLPEKSVKLDLFGSRFCFSIGDKILVETDEENVVYSNNGYRVSSISKDFNLASLTEINNEWIIGNFVTKTHWAVNKQLEFKNLETYFGFTKSLNGNFIRFLPKKLEFFDTYGGDLRWQFDPANYGRNIKFSRDSKEVLSDEPNYISGSPFSDNDNLFIPLEGGQLVALNINNGEFKWMLEQKINGSYIYHSGSIYKKNSKEIFKINPITGSVDRQLNFYEAEISNGLLSTQPFWITNDYIFVCDTLNGTLCQIDKDEFEVVAILKINSKIPNSTNSMIVIEDSAYLIDLDNNLHLIEL